jgi:hypothetical protein
VNYTERTLATPKCSTVLRRSMGDLPTPFSVHENRESEDSRFRIGSGQREAGLRYLPSLPTFTLLTVQMPGAPEPSAMMTV